MAQKLNDIFSDSVKFLEIPINSYLTNVSDHLTDPLDRKIQFAPTLSENKGKCANLFMF